MVDVPTNEEFAALVARVTTLEAHVHELPQNVKDALAIVAAWIQTV
jgi:cell division protein FtsB